MILGIAQRSVFDFCLNFTLWFFRNFAGTRIQNNWCNPSVNGRFLDLNRNIIRKLLYTRAVQKLLTPPFKTKTKDLSINIRFDYFKVFTMEVQSLLRPFQSRQKEREIFNFWKEPGRSHWQYAEPWTTAVFVLEQSWPTFSLFQPIQSSLFFCHEQSLLFHPVSKTRRGCH